MKDEIELRKKRGRDGEKLAERKREILEKRERERELSHVSYMSVFLRTSDILAG